MVLEKLRASQATWKIWGNTEGTLDTRADPQNLPSGLTSLGWCRVRSVRWRRRSRHRYLERAEIYDLFASRITGFATVAGDRTASGQASRRSASAQAV